MPPWFLAVLLTILGAIWGSFVAALCSRWPKGESVTNGRSRCDHCDQQIASYDLIPVASYLLLKGRCRYCRQNIGTMPFATELAAAFIGLVPALLLPESQAFATAIFGWLLLPLIILDHQHLWLPNRLILLLAFIGVLVGPMLTPHIGWASRVAGLFAGYLSLEIVRRVYKRLRQRDGMGAGDPKLFAALGIWLGWQLLPMNLLAASAIGLAIALLGQLMANYHRTAFPLGSYLAVGAFLVAFMA